MSLLYLLGVLNLTLCCSAYLPTLIPAIVKINSAVAVLIKIKSGLLWVRAMFSWALKFTNSVIELLCRQYCLASHRYDTVLHPG